MNITNPEMMITYDDTTGRFVFFEIRSYPPRKKFWVWRLLDISIIKNGASGGGANLSPNCRVQLRRFPLGQLHQLNLSK